MATAGTEVPTPPAPPQSPIARILGVFVSPGETFADIARRPAFVAPLVLLVISSLAVSIVAVNRIGAERIVRQQIERSPRAAQMSPEQIQQRVEGGTKFVQFFTYVGPLIAVPVASLAIAGVLLLMVSFVFGGSSQFQQMLGVVTHGSLPAVLAAILAIVIVLLKDPADVDIQNLVAANLGVAISAETSHFLHRLAVSLDLFSFWQIALMATGISAVARFSFGKSLLAVAIPWAIYVLGASGWAAIRF